jgi:hypothetical protein
MFGALKPVFCILAITLRLGTRKRSNSLEPDMWVASGYLVQEISTGIYK